jgi:hypothetical protein
MKNQKDPSSGAWTAIGDFLPLRTAVVFNVSTFMFLGGLHTFRPLGLTLIEGIRMPPHHR